MPNRIRNVATETNEDGSYRRVRLVFGPPYFVDVFTQDDRVRFVLGATHHGFNADASEVDGELERVINEIRRAHPDLTVD